MASEETGDDSLVFVSLRVSFDLFRLKFRRDILDCLSPGRLFQRFALFLSSSCLSSALKEWGVIPQNSSGRMKGEAAPFDLMQLELSALMAASLSENTAILCPRLFLFRLNSTHLSVECISA